MSLPVVWPPVDRPPTYNYNEYAAQTIIGIANNDEYLAEKYSLGDQAIKLTLSLLVFRLVKLNKPVFQ